MSFFTQLLSRSKDIDDYDSAYSAVRQILDSQPNIRDFSFDPEIEIDAASKIASDRPDLLSAANSAFHAYFAGTKTYPKAYVSISGQMRRCIADALATRFETGPAGNRSGKHRVVIMLPWIGGNINNNIARVAAGYLAGLVRHPDVEDVRLLVTNELGTPRGSNLPNPDARQLRLQHLAILSDYDCKPEHLECLALPLAEEGNFEGLSRFMQEFEPTIIFVPNLGLTAAYVHGLKKRYPAVFLQTSLNNRPSYDYTLYLYLGERRQIGEAQINPDRWRFHRFGYPKFGMGEPVSRAQLGFADDDFILVTVGNRLRVELSEDFMAVIAQFMTENPKAKFLAIGDNDEALVSSRLPAGMFSHMERIRLIGYVNNISEYLRACDLYVNPKRSGGAVSMALSLYSETPIISFVSNDANNFILEELISANNDGYIEKLRKLSRDREYLEDVTARQVSHFVRNHSEDASVSDLLLHFDEAARLHELDRGEG